jgi:hypothetical protein
MKNMAKKKKKNNNNASPGHNFLLYLLIQLQAVGS